MHERAWALAGRARPARPRRRSRSTRPGSASMDMRCQEADGRGLRGARRRQRRPTTRSDVRRPRLRRADPRLHGASGRGRDDARARGAREARAAQAPFLCAALTERPGLVLMRGAPRSRPTARPWRRSSIGEVLRRLARALWAALDSRARRGLPRPRRHDCRGRTSLFADASRLLRTATWWSRVRAPRARDAGARASATSTQPCATWSSPATLIPLEHPGFFACDADRVEALLRADRRSRGPGAARGPRRPRAARAEPAVDARGDPPLPSCWPHRRTRPRRRRRRGAGGVRRRARPSSSRARASSYGERLRRAGRRVDARAQLSAGARRRSTRSAPRRGPHRRGASCRPAAPRFGGATPSADRGAHAAGAAGRPPRRRRTAPTARSAPPSSSAPRPSSCTSRASTASSASARGPSSPGSTPSSRSG